MAPVTIEYGPCRCVSGGTVYIIYDDDPEIAAIQPPVANCSQCKTSSEALLVQSGFQIR